MSSSIDIEEQQIADETRAAIGSLRNRNAKQIDDQWKISGYPLLITGYDLTHLVLLLNNILYEHGGPQIKALQEPDVSSLTVSQVIDLEYQRLGLPD